MNPMQKYLHIIGLSDCVLNMFFMFLCSVNFSVSSGTCSTPKLLKLKISLLLKNKAI